jgi:triacylglycerol esterase/lipase EstA (alpha/beta hydrolase family)
MSSLSGCRRLASRVRARLLTAITVSVVASAALAATSLPGVAQADPLPVNYDFIAGATAAAAAPTTPPPGANNWSCKPTAAHPYPVILVHGVLATMDDDWQAASPVLANHGYCVFALNYGGTSPTAITQGTGDIAASAAQLSAFVGQVLAATGASKVDLVGHSEGGMMPRYYLSFLGGAAKVHTFVALAPANYGTTLDGLVTLGNILGLTSVVNNSLSSSCEACVEMEQGSAFLAHLNTRPTVRGVHYVVIESTYDEVITPWTNALLPPAPNVSTTIVNWQCSLDHTDHIEIGADPVSLADMLNALDPAHPVQVPCIQVNAVTGPPGPVPSF